MRPRVLFLITDSGTGGAEKVLLDHFVHFDRKKVDPCGVVVLKTKKEMARLWEQQGVPVVEMGMRSRPTLAVLFRLWRTIRRFKPDILNSFTIHSVLMGRLMHLFIPSLKVVSNPCLNYRVIPWFAKLIVKWSRFLDNRVVCEGSATRDFLVKKLGFDKKKTTYVPNGVLFDDYQFTEKGRKKVRQELGVPDGQVLIGAVGRLHDQKGFDYLIDALKLLKGNPVSYQTVVIGEGPDRSWLEDKAREASVHIRFVGVRPDVRDVLSAFDIYVQSSRYEGMPIALLEAMSIGCSIVASAVDGTLDLAKDGENMVLVKPHDPVSFSVGLGLLLEKPSLRKKLSDGAKKSVRQYPMENMIRAMEEIYQTV